MKKIFATAILLAAAAATSFAQSDTSSVSPAKEKLKELEEKTVEAVKKHKSSDETRFFSFDALGHFALGFHSLELSDSPSDLNALPFATRSREIALNMLSIGINPTKWLSLSAGFDLKWDQYGFSNKERYFSTTEISDNRYVKLSTNSNSYDYLRSFIKTTSLSFPMSLSFNFGDFSLTGGAEFSYVMDKFSRVIIRSEQGDFRNEESVHGIDLNNNNWSFFGGLSYDDIGLYFKYSPTSIIPDGSNFKMNHYTVGLIFKM